jgi:hypothetical protein
LLTCNLFPDASVPTVQQETRETIMPCSQDKDLRDLLRERANDGTRLPRVLFLLD